MALNENIIYYHPYTQFENLGDLLINKNLIAELRNFGQLRVLDTKIPEWFWSRLDVRPEERVSGSRFARFGQMMAEAVRGRGRVYLVTKPGDVRSLTAGLSRHAALAQILRLSLVSAAGVRVCSIGLSIGKCDGASLAEKLAVATFHRRIFRDSRSAARAPDADGKQGLGCDLAFLSSPRKIPKKTELQRIGISFRGDLSTARYEEVVQSIGSLQSDNLDLIPIYQVRRDKLLMERLARRLDLKEPRSVFDLEEAYVHLDAVISNRLHVLLFGLLNGCSVVPLLEDSEIKVRGTFNDLGAENTIRTMGQPLRLDDLRPGQISNLNERIRALQARHDQAMLSIFGEKEYNV